MCNKIYYGIIQFDNYKFHYANQLHTTRAEPATYTSSGIAMTTEAARIRSKQSVMRLVDGRNEQPISERQFPVLNHSSGLAARCGRVRVRCANVCSLMLISSSRETRQQRDTVIKHRFTDAYHT